MDIEYVYADLALMVTLSEEKDCILKSLTRQERQVLANALYLTIVTFNTTRALYSLQKVIDSKKTFDEKDGG